MTSSSLFRVVALCALAMSPTLAHAADNDRVASPPVSLLGNTGKVAVGEIQVEREFEGQLYPDYVAYFVDVLDQSTEVAAFAVSGDLDPRSSALAFFPGWTARIMSPESWNLGYEFSIGGTTPMTTSALGTATSLFGNDPAISLFYLAESTNTIFDDGLNANDQDADAWEIEHPEERTSNRFTAGGLSRSQFIALDINGQVIDFSVPEPSTLCMAGLAILNLTKRRARIA